MKIQNVLHIPTYYSESVEDARGFSTKEQIEKTDKNNIVLFVEAKKKSKIIESFINTEENTKVIHITHPVGTNFFSRTRNYLNSVTTGLSKLIDLGYKIDQVNCYDAGKNLSIARKYFDYVPCYLYEINNQFLNSDFENLSLRKQKSILKTINSIDKVFTKNQEIKNILISKKITTTITILNKH